MEKQTNFCNSFDYRSLFDTRYLYRRTYSYVYMWLMYTK